MLYNRHARPPSSRSLLDQVPPYWHLKAQVEESHKGLYSWYQLMSHPPYRLHLATAEVDDFQEIGDNQTKPIPDITVKEVSGQ